MISTNAVPTTSTTDLRPYTIFLPLTATELNELGLVKRANGLTRFKRSVYEFVRMLPGFVAFYGGDEWVADPTLGALVRFATPTYAGSAMLDIACTYGAIVGNHHYDYDATVNDRLQAAVVAFQYRPSAIHFARLQAAMLEYQAAHS